MTTPRICKAEKFIPRTGNPVFQVHEELDLPDGRVLSLGPRNPTADELQDAALPDDLLDDAAAAEPDAVATGAASIGRVDQLTGGAASASRCCSRSTTPAIRRAVRAMMMAG